MLGPELSYYESNRRGASREANASRSYLLEVDAGVDAGGGQGGPRPRTLIAWAPTATRKKRPKVCVSWR